jgi:hypothetical protein
MYKSLQDFIDEDEYISEHDEDIYEYMDELEEISYSQGQPYYDTDIEFYIG